MCFRLTFTNVWLIERSPGTKPQFSHTPVWQVWAWALEVKTHRAACQHVSLLVNVTYIKGHSSHISLGRTFLVSQFYDTNMLESTPPPQSTPCPSGITLHKTSSIIRLEGGKAVMLQVLTWDEAEWKDWSWWHLDHHHQGELCDFPNFKLLWLLCFSCLLSCLCFSFKLSFLSVCLFANC